MKPAPALAATGVFNPQLIEMDLTMNPDITPTPLRLWTGRVISAVVILALLADALVNLAAPQKLAADMAATGFALALATPLAVIILVCALVYAVPVTSVLGAILITAFAGGSIAVHFRLGEIGSPPQIISALIAVFAWAGLLLRYPSLWAWLPCVSAKTRRPSAAGV